MLKNWFRSEQYKCLTNQPTNIKINEKSIFFLISEWLLGTDYALKSGISLKQGQFISSINNIELVFPAKWENCFTKNFLSRKCRFSTKQINAKLRNCRIFCRFCFLLLNSLSRKVWNIANWKNFSRNFTILSKSFRSLETLDWTHKL